MSLQAWKYQEAVLSVVAGLERTRGTFIFRCRVDKNERQVCRCTVDKNERQVCRGRVEKNERRVCLS